MQNKQQNKQSEKQVVRVGRKKQTQQQLADDGLVIVPRPAGLRRLEKMNLPWFDLIMNFRLNQSGTHSGKHVVRNFTSPTKLTLKNGIDLAEGIISSLEKDHLNIIFYNKNRRKLRGIKVTRVTHPGWLEWQRLTVPKDKSKSKRTEDIRQLLKNRRVEGPFGRWQYFYSSHKGVISLIRLVNYNLDGKDIWEIWGGGGKLFPDTKRFGSKRTAEKEIRRMLK